MNIRLLLLSIALGLLSSMAMASPPLETALGNLPDAAFPFDLTGRVTRVHEYDNSTNLVPGMGLEFVDVDDDKRVRIEKFVDRLRKELPDIVDV